MKSCPRGLVLVASSLLLSLSSVVGEDSEVVATSRGSFVDVTERIGVRFQHRSGSKQKDWIAEVNGSGVALFDCDGDGDLDVYLVNGSTWDSVTGDAVAEGKVSEGGTLTAQLPRNTLLRNDGAWKFRDVTEVAGVGDTGWGSGVAVADVDNDGDLDLYVTNRGPNVLFLNDGKGLFRRALASGVDSHRWGSAASFADFDRDGRVDLFVVNYLRFERDPKKRRGAASCTYKGQDVFCGPGGLTPQADELFLNLGKGRFRDVSEEWGLSQTPASFGLGSLVVDVDRNGYPDILVANDTRPNHCFLNRGGKSFTEAGVFLGLAYNASGVAQAGMGLASGDTRGSGREDIFVTNFEDDTNTLSVAEEDAFFADWTYPAGLGAASYPFLGWGTFFFDANGDGSLDLFVANGHVAPQVDRVEGSAGYRQRNQLFLGSAKGRFLEARAALPSEEKKPFSSRGAACGDLDGDGDPDIVVNNIDARPTFLENRSAGTWVTVRLRGTRSNTAAIGARVLLTAGGKTQQRRFQSGMSWASQCELSACFGLGKDSRAERLRVVWPSGRVEDFTPPSAGASVLAIEGEGRAN